MNKIRQQLAGRYDNGFLHGSISIYRRMIRRGDSYQGWRIIRSLDYRNGTPSTIYHDYTLQDREWLGWDYWPDGKNTDKIQYQQDKLEEIPTRR